ncbi:MAG: hypothetical protein PHV32_02535 [Eubacteriales bacterium]|nr:hypothetical protein [Eubacteriales bacterium]
MSKWLVRCIAACASIIIFLTGCSLKNILQPSENAAVSEDGMNTTAKDPAEKHTVEKLNLLGDVTFVPDSDGAKEAVFSYEETVLRVKDSSGFTWKLTIPANGLLSEETITMTPLKDVKDARGRELSGVLLEPDGLKFIMPATLTITGDGAEQGWIYCADHSGKNPEFILVQQPDGKIEGKISHFSSAIVDQNPNLLDPEKKAVLDNWVKKTIPKVKDLLEDDLELPNPPKIDLECYDDDADAEVGEYKKELSGDETAYLAGLAQAYAVYIKMGDPMAGEIRPLLNQLSKRAEAKIVEFYEKYSPDPERYFLAVALIEDAAVAYGSQFITGEESSGELDDSVFKRIMDILRDWGKQTMEYIIEQIRTKHNYKLMAAALITNNMLQAADVNLLDKLRDAFTFKVSFDGKLVDSDEHGTTTWSTKGEALVRLESVEKFALSGEGVGMNTDYHTTDKVMVPFMLTKDFPVDVQVYLAPCGKEQAVVFIDKLGAESLTYKDEDGQEYTAYSVFNGMWILLKDNYDKKKNMFGVVMDFESGGAVFEETMKGSSETAEVTYTIRLEHSPQ